MRPPPRSLLRGRPDHSPRDFRADRPERAAGGDVKRFHVGSTEGDTKHTARTCAARILILYRMGVTSTLTEFSDSHAYAVSSFKFKSYSKRLHDSII